MTGSPQPNHEARALSTSASPTPSERANQVIYRPGLPGGHVESLFLKGNSPDGRRALWIKYTLLAPIDASPEVAELWAVAFERDRRDGPRANKRTYPMAAASFRSEPFALSLPDGELRHGAARGELGFDAQGGARLRWDLRFSCPHQPFYPFPSQRMYTGPFPRTKTLTPVPDTKLLGFFEVDGERWDVSGYPAAQGHNWGKGHARAYAWAHTNTLKPLPGTSPVQRVWLEALSARVRVGRLETPWLSTAAISIDDELYRFDGWRALLSRSSRCDLRSYSFALRQGGATLSAKLWAEDAQLAGLCYRDPDGQTLSCLNSKLAHAQVELRVRGRTWSFETDQAALELGTRRADHGVRMLA